ncbi:MAG TPA: penicillin-binding protein 2 [Rhodospirillaceae bacterium]|nr:penicillin-binding protein 2 [Rhodospirillaceae bacterium]
MILSRLRIHSIKIAGERSSAIDQARGRLVLISAVFMLCYMMIAVRVVDLTLIQGQFGQVRGPSELAVSDPVVTNAAPAAAVAARADIVDRNGVLLATTLKMASLYANPALIDDAESTARGLAKIFPELSYGDVLQKLQKGKNFIWIRRNLTPEQQYAVLELGQPGLGFERQDARIYPQGPLAAHLVGYADIDNHGLAGVERSFDSYLSDGKPLTLSVDIRLQHALRREVQKAISDFSAIGGTGVIMDVTNGEILAGVSLPDFDPNAAGSAKKDAVFNRLTLGVYELGSMFKIFSTAALLETQGLPMSTKFDAREPIKIGRFTINDYHAQKRVLTIPEVFMHSSNIGSALMGQTVGTKALRDFYTDIGLLTPMEIEISEIGKPQHPERWGEIDTLTASYGHGISTTPLQMVSAVSTIVNGGFFVKPKLVMGAESASAENSALRVVSPQTAESMRKLMRLVVTEGTGEKADVPGYSVGGKTGTAEKTGIGGYDRNRLISSFVGVFPMEEPRYAVMVMVDEPKGNKKSFGYATAGWVAAPAVSRTIASMGSILNIPAKPLGESVDISESLKQYVSDEHE